MQEVTQAAQRLRLAFECEEFAADMADLLTTDVDPQLPRDLSIVARAYLAEHAEDDDELITEDWWRSNSSPDVHTIHLGEVWLELVNGVVAIKRVGCQMLLPIATRGQLRLLIRALS